MGEFEDRLREAFHDELQRMPPPGGLRQRMIASALATPRSRWPTRMAALTTPRSLALAGAAAVALAAVIAGVYVLTH